MSRKSRYLEVELKASIRSYRFFFCEGLHEVLFIAEQKQISNKGGQNCSHWNSYILSTKLLETVAKMTLEDYIKCMRSLLNTPKVFLNRAQNEMRVNFFNGKILLAWEANLDIQIVLESYGCASYIVGYISKSQRGMSAGLEAAAKESRKEDSDIKNK